MEHFKVLPTDDRFKQLTDRQKELLWVGFLNGGDDNAMRSNYQEQQRNDMEIDEQEEEDLLKCGYTKEKIARMKAELKKVSLSMD
jgi:hypothetical protein